MKVLEVGASGRREAAKRYALDYVILHKLGELCSTKGDAIEARKFPDDGQLKPLTAKEKQWMIAATRKLIFRAGNYAFDPKANLPHLTMKDLPDL